MTEAQWMVRAFLWVTPTIGIGVGVWELLFSPRPSSLQLVVLCALFLAAGIVLVRGVESQGR